MIAKASLHIHTREDFKDYRVIDYSIYELIDEAEKFNFSFLALTGHDRFIGRPEYVAYAKKRGITLILGVELPIGKKHILVLNCDHSIDGIETFADLKRYKKDHPGIFIIAAHPDFGFKHSLRRKKLRSNAELFDAIEHSWFYSRRFNLNRRNKILAEQLNLPFIATADVHELSYLNRDYLEVEVSSLSIRSLFEALRQKRFTNVSNSKTFGELVRFQLRLRRRFYLSFFRKSAS